MAGPSHEGITVRHPSGRSIHARVFGARDSSRVLVYSHGFPATSIEARLAHDLCKELNIALVAIDRPGMGGSEWYPGRRVEDWTGDVTTVLDSLSVERFALLGVSGGTPTAVGVAAALPERVSSLTIVSGVAPMTMSGALEGINGANRFLIRSAHTYPALARFCVGCLAAAWGGVPLLAELWFGALLPKVDREVLSRQRVSGVMARSIKEALQAGRRGAVTDFEIIVSNWESVLASVTVPTFVWHGDDDTYVPLSMGRIVSDTIPGAVFHQVAGVGHFMIVDKLAEILSAIVWPENGSR